MFIHIQENIKLSIETIYEGVEFFEAKMKKLNPLVSILMPTFNRTDGFRRALSRALEQTYDNIEFIVSDNASDNECGVQEIVTWAESTYKRRIIFYRQEANIGPLANFEFLFRVSSGEYVIIWPDDDDYKDKFLVSELIKSAQQHEDTSLAIPEIEVLEPSQRQVRLDSPPYFLDNKSKICRALSYFTRDVNDIIMYGMISSKYIKDFHFPRSSHCPEKFFILHLLFSGKFSNSKGRLTNIHVQRSAREVEFLHGVSINVFRHDMLIVRYILKRLGWFEGAVIAAAYIATQAKFFSFPARKLFCLPRKAHGSRKKV